MENHNCLTYSNFGKSEWRLSKKGSKNDNKNDDEISVPVTGNFRVNEATAITQATLASAGIALQPSYIAGPLIQQGQLIKLLPEWEPPVLGIWGVYLSRHHVSAAQKTFLAFLVKRFEGIPEWEV